MKKITDRVRPADAGDRTFVISSWLDSYRTSHSAGMIGMEDWYAVMWPQLAKIVDRPHVQTLVAYDAHERDRIADLNGFITFDLTHGDPLVFYIYVKQTYRREGRARMLFDAAGIDPRARFSYGCKTAMLTRLAPKIPHAKWDPLLARETRTKEPTT